MTARDQALVDGGFGDQFPVELAIVVQANTIGVDRGVLWFADGLMGFSGSAASFVLASSDLEPTEKGRHHPRSGQPYPAGAILLKRAPQEAYVVIIPLKGHEAGYEARLKRFEDESPTADAERFWPPLHCYVTDDAPFLEPAVSA